MFLFPRGPGRALPVRPGPRTSGGRSVPPRIRQVAAGPRRLALGGQAT